MQSRISQHSKGGVIISDYMYYFTLICENDEMSCTHGRLGDKEEEEQMKDECAENRSVCGTSGTTWLIGLNRFMPDV